MTPISIEGHSCASDACSCGDLGSVADPQSEAREAAYARTSRRPLEPVDNDDPRY